MWQEGSASGSLSVTLGINHSVPVSDSWEQPHCHPQPQSALFPHCLCKGGLELSATMAAPSRSCMGPEIPRCGCSKRLSRPLLVQLDQIPTGTADRGCLSGDLGQGVSSPPQQQCHCLWPPEVTLPTSYTLCNAPTGICTASLSLSPPSPLYALDTSLMTMSVTVASQMMCRAAAACAPEGPRGDSGGGQRHRVLLGDGTGISRIAPGLSQAPSEALGPRELGVPASCLLSLEQGQLCFSAGRQALGPGPSPGGTAPTASKSTAPDPGPRHVACFAILMPCTAPPQPAHLPSSHQDLADLNRPSSCASSRHSLPSLVLPLGAARPVWGQAHPLLIPIIPESLASTKHGWPSCACLSDSVVL